MGRRVPRQRLCRGTSRASNRIRSRPRRDADAGRCSLGLNRSGNLPAANSNFHTPTRAHYDYRLTQCNQDGGLQRLQGAYMTDLVDEVEPNSHNVAMTDDDAAVLLEQLYLIDESAYHVVCSGTSRSTPWSVTATPTRPRSRRNSSVKSRNRGVDAPPLSGLVLRPLRRTPGQAGGFQAPVTSAERATLLNGQDGAFSRLAPDHLCTSGLGRPRHRIGPRALHGNSRSNCETERVA